VLARSGKPFAVIDELGTVKLPDNFRNNRKVKIFTIAGRLAGTQAGQFLLDRRHRKVVYCSAYHSQPWSQWRYQGVQEAFSCLDHPGKPDKWKSDRGNAMLVSSTLPDTGQFTLDPETEKALSRILGRYEKSLIRHSFTYVPPTSAIVVSLLTLMEDDAAYRTLYPVFENILDTSDATAWIIANDYVATAAIDFLNSRKVRLPQDISVFAFDDSDMAYEYGLTSYNFNFLSIAQQALAFVIYPTSRSFLHAPQTIECPGYIVERATTGIAR
jgi:DNA-binding LacI/PurR family transcriptional regulator